MNVEQYARDYGLTDPYINKLNTANKFVEDSALQDRNAIQSQLNNQLGDYERYRQEQDQKATKEGQNAYVDYAKSINPFGSDNESRFKLGLGDSGMAESSRIGANNSYQNRVSDVVGTRDKIFSDINANISKAKETFNVEAAKIEKAKQERFLENLYKINDEFKAEKQAQEERRRWEAEMSLSRQKASGGYPGQDLNGSKVITDYYQGDFNPDVNNGTFGTLDKNGNAYQPDNVGGNKLKKSGKTVGQVLGNISNTTGTTTLGNQNIWTANGRSYVWDGSANRYIDVTSSIKGQSGAGGKRF